MLQPLFISLSASKPLRAVAESSTLGQRVSRRFVAGTTLEEVVDAVRVSNRQGLMATIDHLGENVSNRDEAQRGAEMYHRLLDAIKAEQLNANISCKLTHLGFDVDSGFCRELVCGLVRHAAQSGNFVRIDMEGSAYTEPTVRMVREIHAAAGADAVGTVMQAYLRKSEQYIDQLCAERIRVRLVKGAYKEPASVALQKKSEVDENFVRLMRKLLKSGIYHAIATHDEQMIEATLRFARQEKLDRYAFEFQMLYGIRRDLQQKLAREGWAVRVYIPFGTEWYPYFMRRLAERPANVWFIAKNLLRA